MLNETIKRVVRSGWYILGKENEEFEEKLSKYLNVPNVVGVGSGFDALKLFLKHTLN